MLAGRVEANAQIQNLGNAKLAAQPPGSAPKPCDDGPLFSDMLEKQLAHCDGIGATSLFSSGNHLDKIFRATIRRARRIAASTTVMHRRSQSNSTISLIRSISKKGSPAAAVNKHAPVHLFLCPLDSHHNNANTAQVVPFQQQNTLQSLPRGPSQLDVIDVLVSPLQDNGSHVQTLMLVSSERSAFHVPRRRRPDQPPLPEPDLSLLRYLARRPAVVASYLPDPKPDIFPHCPSPFSPSD